MKASLYSAYASSKKLLQTTVCIYWKVTKFKMAELEFHDLFWKQANFFWKYIYYVSSIGLFSSKILTLIFDKFIICSYYFGTITTTTITKNKKQRKTQKLSHMYTSHLLCDLFLGCAEGYSKDG